MLHLDLVLAGSLWEASGLWVYDGSREGDREVGIAQDY